MTDPSDLHEAARSFVAAAFDVLRRDHVIPTPVFHPYIKVGRDYYGQGVRALPEYSLVEQQLNDAYPNRFADPLTRRHPEFASTYLFSLLEASVARCGRADDFSPESAAVGESIKEMLTVLDARQYGVVCCRVVSHITTQSGEPVQIGPVTVVPADDGYRSAVRAIATKIPGAPAAFNRDPPFVHDPPHSVLVTQEITSEEDEYAVADRLSRSLERFLLHMRLLTSGTVQSYYEVKGTTTLVTRMPPYLATFIQGVFASPVRRTVRVTGSEADAASAIGKLIAEAEVKRQGMVMTSFDAAIRKFNQSYRADDWWEHLVDLATALEATLASGDEDNEGLTLRLRNRAAALLATENDLAKSVFADVGLLYSLRSKLVHGGPIKEKELRSKIDRISTMPREQTLMWRPALGHAVDRMRDLVRRAILARLCLAAQPNPLWPFVGSTSVDTMLADDRTRGEWRSYWHERMTQFGAVLAADRPRAAADVLSQDDGY